MNVFTLPFMLHARKCQKKKKNHAWTHADYVADAAAPYSHRVKRTGPVHLHSCRLHVCLFCFFLKVHRPPLDSYESHAGGAAAELKVCHRGEAPVAGLKSPIATQSPRQEGPAQEQRRAGEGERCPLETQRPSTCCLDRYGFTQGCVSLLRSRQGLGWERHGSWVTFCRNADFTC